jgi:hypothetical protein
MKLLIVIVAILTILLGVFAIQVSSVIGPSVDGKATANATINGYSLEPIKDNPRALGVRDLQLAATPVEITAAFTLFSQFGSNKYPDLRLVVTDSNGRSRERIIAKDGYQHSAGDVTVERLSVTFPRRGDEARVTVYPVYSK